MRRYVTLWRSLSSHTGRQAPDNQHNLFSECRKRRFTCHAVLCQQLFCIILIQIRFLEQVNSYLIIVAPSSKSGTGTHVFQCRFSLYFARENMRTRFYTKHLSVGQTNLSGDIGRDRQFKHCLVFFIVPLAFNRSHRGNPFCFCMS